MTTTTRRPARSLRWQTGPLDYAGSWWFLAALYTGFAIRDALTGTWWFVAIEVVCMAYIAVSLRDVHLAEQIARRGCVHPSHPSRLCGCTTRRRQEAAAVAAVVSRASAVLARWGDVPPVPVIPTRHNSQN